MVCLFLQTLTGRRSSDSESLTKKRSVGHDGGVPGENEVSGWKRVSVPATPPRMRQRAAPDWPTLGTPESSTKKTMSHVATVSQHRPKTINTQVLVFFVVLVVTGLVLFLGWQSAPSQKLGPFPGGNDERHQTGAMSKLNFHQIMRAPSKKLGPFTGGNDERHQTGAMSRLNFHQIMRTKPNPDLPKIIPVSSDKLAQVEGLQDSRWSISEDNLREVDDDPVGEVEQGLDHGEVDEGWTMRNDEGRENNGVVEGLGLDEIDVTRNAQGSLGAKETMRRRWDNLQDIMVGDDGQGGVMEDIPPQLPHEDWEVEDSVRDGEVESVSGGEVEDSVHDGEVESVSGVHDGEVESVSGGEVEDSVHDGEVESVNGGEVEDSVRDGEVESVSGGQEGSV